MAWSSLIHAEHSVLMSISLESQESLSKHLLVLQSKRLRGKYALLGLDGDAHGHLTIGLVLSLLYGGRVRLDGDGGLSYHSPLRGCRPLVFKPVHIKALWNLLQTLHMVSDALGPQDSDHQLQEQDDQLDWDEMYSVSSPQPLINAWRALPDILSTLRHTSEMSVQFRLSAELRSLMAKSDLDSLTSKVIRSQLESSIGMDLESYKSFIDAEMLLILGQMDPASRILDYLYLGSEWNASNLDELISNNIGCVLNVTREIDNFFETRFTYCNVREYDEESVDLLNYFDSTYKFIKNAKEKRQCVLVHCKMGISRSATIVVSYLMKEYNMDLEQAIEFTKQRRSVVRPNKAFRRQLEVYQGMLNASDKRRAFAAIHNDDVDYDHHIEDDNNSGWSSFALEEREGCVKRLAHFFLNGGEIKLGTSTNDNDNDHNDEDNDDCSSSALPLRSPAVNSSRFNCDCSVEVELNVPQQPVVVTEANFQTDQLVSNLSSLGQAVHYSCETQQTSFSKRRQVKSLGNTSSKEEDELSVKTLANMFKLRVTSVPMKPCVARLEDNQLFQRATKELASD